MSMHVLTWLNWRAKHQTHASYPESWACCHCVSDVTVVYLRVAQSPFADNRVTRDRCCSNVELGWECPTKHSSSSSSYALHLWNEGIQIYATIWPFFVAERKKFLMKIPQPPRQPYLTILLIIPLVMTGLAAGCTQNSLYTFAFRLQSQKRRCRVSLAVHKYCVT